MLLNGKCKKKGRSVLVSQQGKLSSFMDRLSFHHFYQRKRFHHWKCHHNSISLNDPVLPIARTRAATRTGLVSWCMWSVERSIQQPPTRLTQRHGCSCLSMGSQEPIR